MGRVKELLYDSEVAISRSETLREQSFCLSEGNYRLTETIRFIDRFLQQEGVDQGLEMLLIEARRNLQEIKERI